jgi:hypothetical protein
MKSTLAIQHLLDSYPLSNLGRGLGVDSKRIAK